MSRTIYVLAALSLLHGFAWAGKPGPNQAPTVVLSAPANGESFVPGSNITLAASAADADGTVAKVEFFRGTTLIGSDTAAPYSAVWTNAIAGNYSITAKATDNLGAVTSSAAAAVSIAMPRITFSSPANNAVVYGGAASVSGTFVGDTTTTVLVDNGNSTRLAALNGNNFSVNMPVFLGQNTLRVLVSRRDKTFDTGSVTVTGAEAPMIMRIAPGTTTFDAPATIDFAVDAVSTAGSIAKVAFTKNGVLANEVAAPPYRASFSNLAAGSYNLQATATDSLGATATESFYVQVTGPNQLPVASVTSPASNAVFTAPASMTIAASASDPDGSIAVVEFFQNGVSLNATNLAPYRYNWNRVAPGTYALTVAATDSRGGVTTSAPVTVSVVPPNSAPVVALTSPEAGANVLVPSTVTLAASASDSDGTISKVEFFKGTELIGTATVAPYAINWTVAAPGNYSLTAQATDNAGGSATSAPVSVVATAPPNVEPTVALTGPAGGSSFIVPATIALTATASDADGTISKVEFFNGSELVGTAATAPYTVGWAVASPGTYSLTARATDNASGVTTSAPVTVSASSNQPPAVTLSHGASGPVYAPATVLLSADASDLDGAIVRVDFFENGVLAGTATAAPYTFTRTFAEAGSYSMTAVATDNLGGASTSAPVTLVVGAPALTITAPASGHAVNGNFVLVSGTFAALPNSGVTVNGVVAALTDDGRFFARVPVVEGSNDIAATLATAVGPVATRSVVMTADGIPSPIHVEAGPLEGLSSLTAEFKVSNTGTVASNVQVNGGAPLVLSPGEQGSFTLTLAGAGAAPAVISATDTLGNTSTQEFMLVVNDGAAMDAMLKSLWSGMGNALKAGDKAAALAYMNENGKAQYGPVFDKLMPQMAGIVGSFSAPQKMAISGAIGEYAVNRTIDGVGKLFFVYFLKGADGVWRLESM